MPVHDSSHAAEPERNQRGFYDVGSNLKGARTDDELVSAVLHRSNDTVRTNRLRGHSH